MLAVAQSFDSGLDDMRRRFEIGLADAEIDDVTPLALQFSRSRQHGEGVFLADALKGGLDGGHCFCVSGGRGSFWQSRARGARATLDAPPSRLKQRLKFLQAEAGLFDDGTESAWLEVAARMDWHNDRSRPIAGA